MPTARFAAPLLAAVLLLTACGDGRNRFEAPPPPEVTVDTPERRTVTNYYEFPARLQATESVNVRARVQGFLQQMHFTPASRVEKGQLLFTIEPEPFEAAVASAEARVAKAEAALQLAETRLDRIEAALEKGAASDLERIEAVAQRDEAAATVRETEAALAQARIDLGYTEIHAPIAGRVGRDLVDVGNLVGAGESTLLTTLVADDPIHVYFNVDERIVLEYLERRPSRTSQERPVVDLTLLDGEVYPHQGQVDYVDNRVDPNTGTLEVRAVVPNPSGKLFPGLFARVRFVDQQQERLVVPETAIQRDLAGDYVMAVNEENRVVRVDVRSGARVDQMRAIESGLSGDERIVVAGLQRARVDAVVSPVQREAPPDDGASAPEPAGADQQGGG